MAGAAELIRLGFHGFAFAMLFLGFRLLRKAIVDKDLQGPKLKLVLKHVTIFICIAFVFFAAGAAFELFSHSYPHRISVLISPADMPPSTPIPAVKVKCNAEIVQLEEGYAAVEVRERDTLHLSVWKLIQRIEELTVLLGVASDGQSKHDEGGVYDE